MKYILTLSAFIFILSCHSPHIVEDKLGLQKLLEGSWKAEAFDGHLYDSWHLDEDGFMKQLGVYKEGNDTLYQATTKIEKIGETLFLYSIIKDGTPKIFKASERKKNSIVFENKDYKNPFKVTYVFRDKNNYTRTIEGTENDSLVTYTFNFKRMNTQ